MKQIQDALTMCFKSCDNLADIVLSYSGRYFENLSHSINPNKKINVINALSNNRIAIAYDRGVYIFDLLSKNKIKMIHRSLKTKVSAICELNESTIACGFYNNANILIWNFINNKKYVINNKRRCNNTHAIYNCKENSLVLLKKDLIGYVDQEDSAFSSYYEHINIINLNNNHILQIAIEESVNILMANNKFICKGISLDSGWDEQYISVTDLDACYSLNIMDYYCKFKHIQRKVELDVPPYDKRIISTDDNHLSTTSRIDICQMPISSCKNDLITTYNINTLETVICITENIINEIIALENRCIGVLTADYIAIYHGITGSKLQIIDNVGPKIKFIRYLNNYKFLTVDDDSNIKIYEQ